MKPQRGAALIVALFLIVVLALLGAVAARMTAVQSQSVSLQLLSARALHAARAGIEWGAQRAVTGGVCLNSTVTLPEAALTGFIVDVSCTTSTHAEQGKVIEIYRITSFSRRGIYGQPDYVSRRITSTVSRTL